MIDINLTFIGLVVMNVCQSARRRRANGSSPIWRNDRVAAHERPKRLPLALAFRRPSLSRQSNSIQPRRPNQHGEGHLAVAVLVSGRRLLSTPRSNRSAKSPSASTPALPPSTNSRFGRTAREKALAARFVTDHARGQHFEGDIPIEAFGVSAVDDAHPTGPNLLQNAIVAKNLTSGRYRGRHACRMVRPRMGLGSG